MNRGAARYATHNGALADLLANHYADYIAQTAQAADIATGRQLAAAFDRVPDRELAARLTGRCLSTTSRSPTSPQPPPTTSPTRPTSPCR